MATERARRPVTEGNRQYRHNLAAALISAYGFDSALEMCCRNGWGETVAAVRCLHRQMEDGDSLAGTALTA